MTSISDNKQRLLDLFTSFINSFDGSPTAFATAEPILEKLFDPSFLLVTENGTKDLKWYTAFAKSFAESGNVAKVTSIAYISDHVHCIHIGSLTMADMRAQSNFKLRVRIPLVAW